MTVINLKVNKRKDMERKILVTSANGHVGTPTVKELLSLGLSVRAFVRSSNSDGSKALKKLGAEDSLISVASRQFTLKPSPPPGATGIEYRC